MRYAVEDILWVILLYPPLRKRARIWRRSLGWMIKGGSVGSRGPRIGQSEVGARGG